MKLTSIHRQESNQNLLGGLLLELHGHLKKMGESFKWSL